MAARRALLCCAFFFGCAPLSDDVEDIEPQHVPEHDLGERSEHPHAPLALTATDGTQLRLLSIHAEAVVEQPLAFTELHLVFENAEDRVIEGRFRIELPERAAISRFAMKIGGSWQEGEVVERQAARQAYEDFLHNRQDPALLEHEAGNTFGARVFPIQPHEKKELIVSYSQELPSAATPFRIALLGLPELDSFSARIVRREPGEDGTALARKHVFAEEAWTPTFDLVIASVQPPGAVALRRGELAVARITADGDAAPTPLGAVAILVDTSASRAVGFEGKIHRLGELVEAMIAVQGGDFPLRVIAFDQTSATIHDGSAHDFGRAQQRLVDGRALGASDLGGALASLADDVEGTDRVVVVSDGIITAGETEIAGLEQVAHRLAEAGVRRIDAVLDAGARDDLVMRALTTEVAPDSGLVVGAELPVAAIADKLAREVLPPVTVTVPGADWVWPRRLEGVQPGDELLVYAALGSSKPMRIELDGHPAIVPHELRAERPLLERAWVRANIERLQLKRSALPTEASSQRAELAREIVALSVEHRVLCDLTALLVLESESDYARYGIGRRALAEILTVGESGTTLLRRAERAELPEPTQRRDRGLDPVAPADRDDLPPPADDADASGSMMGEKIGEAYGVGGLGLVGTGRGGGGTGEGTIGLGNTGMIGASSGAPARVPIVRQSRAEVKGSLDKEIIRRVVRAHINEVRACYSQGLVRDPELAGRVTVQFTIGPTGGVPVSTVAEGVADEAVGKCIAKAIKRWKFPAPEAGNVVVTYPFVLGGHGGWKQAAMPLESSDPRRAIAPPRAVTPRTNDELAATQESSPWAGNYAAIRAALAEGRKGDALAKALAWREHDAGDVLAVVALGEVAEALGDRGTAMRAYGSIIDLYPSRADLRRYAGARLDAVGAAGRELAIDSYAKALASRPDHPTSHRLLAMATAASGHHAEAVELLHAALASPELRWDRFPGAREILREDLAVIGAAWLAQAPKDRQAIEAALARDTMSPAREPTTRFVLGWETDANDVDFHIEDAWGGHAYYATRTLATGGELLADVTTGYGPEQFAITGKPLAGPYHVWARYFARGPMGFGMGALQIVTHDGKGKLGFETRPFVIMTEGGLVDLGRWSAG